MESRDNLSITNLVLNRPQFSLKLSNFVAENGYRVARELSRSDELPNCFLDGL